MGSLKELLGAPPHTGLLQMHGLGGGLYSQLYFTNKDIKDPQDEIISHTLHDGQELHGVTRIWG